MTTEAIIHIANRTSETICILALIVLTYEIINLIYVNNKK